MKHGWIGWSQYFKEYGRSIDIFPNYDSYTEEAYKNAKIDVQDLINYESIYEQIEKASKDVKAYEINPSHCTSRSKRNTNADTIDILCDFIEPICKNTDKNFILAYSNNPDGLLHQYGCQSDEVKEFVLDAEKKIEFEQVFKERFGEDFILYTKEEFLGKNMLGFGNKHKKIDDFIGNYIALSIRGASFKLGTYVSKEKTEKKSTHCGLSCEEMEVPLIII